MRILIFYVNVVRQITGIYCSELSYKFFFHRTAIQQVKDQIEKEIYNGFKAYPDYRKCKDCPLNEKCKVKAEAPLITEVFY